jgi:APA family basic amino acid/polyamine antiporter
VLGRGVGSPALFAIVWTSLASAILFSLGVVTENALGLTPLVFLVGAVFFALASMTYVEGASLHQERAGSTVFARYAFNELVSFVAGWAVLLDFVILIAVTAFSATHYAAAFWSPLADGGAEIAMTAGIILYVALQNVWGVSRKRLRRVALLVATDVVLQLALVVVGLATFFDLDVLTSSIDLGTAPQWDELLFSLGVATVVMTGLESASGLAGEVRVGRRGLRRLVSSATLSVAVVYVGIALVAVTALPITDGTSPLAEGSREAPLLGVLRAFSEPVIADGAYYVFAAAATLTLVAAANSAMLGLARLAYSLSRNRQIPSALGRLHPRRSTPYVLITIAAVLAFCLTLPADLELLVGIYAFGALLALTIAHASIVVSRFREPERDRPYRVPLNVAVRGASLPLPAVAGAVLSAIAFASVLVFHDGARWVGLGWLAAGLTLYVVYRTSQEKPLLKRVVVSEKSLRERAEELAYGSILVPITGSALDVDIVQTAGRLAGEQEDEGLEEEEREATIEAIWVFEVPMSLPIDARLPDAQVDAARAALRQAKAVGEEYQGVHVRTTTVRARRAGAAIVDEARRRGVQAIVLAADRDSGIRGGARLGGGRREDMAGAMTRYVLAKATVPVILTAPPREEAAAPPDAESRPAVA